MKHEWKKQEKNLYGAKKVPQIVTVPVQSYIMIRGKGNPNDVDFSNRVAALYSLAYAIKMSCKAGAAIGNLAEGISDYAVYPLEGVWQKKEGNELVKEELVYTIMIRQPDFITKELVCSALEGVKKKKPSPLLEEIFFDTNEDGQCLEILHIGSFDDEPASFQKMDEFADLNGFERIADCHREIYLNNANRVIESKLQTILRYQVAGKNT